MEDQPADSGDLTTGEPDKPRRKLFGRRRRAEAAVEPVEPVEPVEADEVEGGDATPEPRMPTGKAGRKAAEPEPEAEAEIEAEAEAEQVLVPHREAGKRLTYVAAGAAVLFVAAGAFGGAMLQPYLADRALVATKLHVARTSADAITTLWTYNPDNIETLPDRAERFLSNDFAAEYRQFIDTIVPSNKQAQVSNDTEVMGTAVESISRDEATAIVYTNTVSTSPVTKNIPSLRYLSFRLTLHRSDGDWRITEMPTLTQLDLTPQL
ncbi:mammalian cell entry protein [Mycobacterium sp. TNTM28]|uniref:Mammalian cell entry protein n=1 Tax=[Mycobacterium] fortunisiensis TaxID=2600579 RepID=A0ABS6KFK3_9MYCO|nr:mammalian cell entry protein [[Mycobacterium] fortunisiensis]MBU9762344.1 mammalian cell entry protein [[Mycobacterium] fortunisiensis]